jgi:predicted RND superfamily exporter protein
VIERFLLFLARLVVRSPRAVAAVTAAAAAAGAVLVSAIPLRTDLLDAFPEGNPALVAFRDFTRDFGALDGLVVAVSVPEASPDRLIAAVDALGERLGRSPLVTSVDYNALRSASPLFAEAFPAWLDPEGVARLDERLTAAGIRRQAVRNRDALLSPFGNPVEGELIARDPLDLRGIVRAAVMRRSLPKGTDTTTGYYMDAGKRTALLLVRPAGKATDMAFGGKLLREIDRIVAEAHDETEDPSWTVGVTGGYALAAEAAAAIRRDMAVSFAVSFVLVMGAIALAYRPPPAVLAVFVFALFVALSWTIGAAYLLYGSLNVVTSVVAAMLIGLYVDYLIQVYCRFDEVLRETGDPEEAVARTMAGTGKAVVTGSLTTAVSFFAIVVTSFRGLHELGVVTGLGVLFCLAAALLPTPALLLLAARRSPALVFAGRPGGIGVEWAARLVASRRRLVLAAFAALAVAAVAASVLRTGFDTDMESMGLRDSEARTVQRTVDERFGRKGEPLFLVARASDGAALGRDFDAMERLGRELRSSGRVGDFSSPGLFLPPPSEQEAARTALSERKVASRWDGASLAAAIRRAMGDAGLSTGPEVDDYARGIVSALARKEPVTLSDLSRSGDRRVDTFASPSGKAVAAYLTSPGASWDEAALGEIERSVRRMGSDFTLVGPRVMMAAIRDSILLESGIAIAISVLANVLLVWFHFRRGGRVLRVMLPLAAGTTATVGAMALFGIRFNFFNVVGIALISGFGVDYGIYMMQAHLEGGGCGGAEAVLRTGGRTALCALTTVLSCGSLVTTRYQGVASIGWVLSLGALFCLLAALLLLPATIREEGAGEEG